jgi:RNA recognition motif-containing protein
MIEIRRDFKVLNTPGDRACGVQCEPSPGEPDYEDDLRRGGRPNPTVRVDRIESQTTIVELKKLFKPFGRVLEIGILEARDGDRLSMSATVTMADPYSALDAVRQLDGFKLRGLPIEVSILED